MALRNIMNDQKDDILRKKARIVEKVDFRTRTLLEDMAETMYHSNGAGLAAPQVGVLRRVIVIDDGNGLIKLINPVIVKALGEQQEIEGCLSVPGIYGKVKRPEKVIVKALDENGRPYDLEGSGLLARALCHEIDHLDGILFIDKMIPGTIIKQSDLPGV
ncbi:Peptide deformylase 1 [Caprobacter fermentans]|uniref:Peptide deformylase n=1 Tax=Caproicibacter fermentans TaxID=2576756 RepID=A0A6N8HWS7_9FIRM|nr:peptide deformylase [Caproicibacter fermentans]MVB09853.1 Peptide deformylase 1 [Caproicibacter fermentans]OCN02025.1 peptide deformylase [Clostridium sp. W14A]